jgi:hypothetical protein
VAGSNLYRLSETENERIFRKEILPKWLNDAAPNLHSVEHPPDGHYRWSAAPMHAYACAKLKMA